MQSNFINGFVDQVENTYNLVTKVFEVLIFVI